MPDTPFVSIQSHFGDLADPRDEGRCDHCLFDIGTIHIALCGIIHSAAERIYRRSTGIIVKDLRSEALWNAQAAGLGADAQRRERFEDVVHRGLRDKYRVRRKSYAALQPENV
jgi:hypothetical protein